MISAIVSDQRSQPNDGEREEYKSSYLMPELPENRSEMAERRACSAQYRAVSSCTFYLLAGHAGNYAQLARG